MLIRCCNEQVVVFVIVLMVFLMAFVILMLMASW